MIRQLADEIQQLRVPANSILFMASMVIAMHNRMQRVPRARGAGSPMTFDAIEREMLQNGTAAPALVHACFELIRETERSVRDQQRLTDVVLSCGERWGVAANLTLAYIYTGIARGVVAIDPSVETLGALLAEVSLDEEADLLAKGED